MQSASGGTVDGLALAATLDPIDATSLRDTDLRIEIVNRSAQPIELSANNLGPYRVVEEPCDYCYRLTIRDAAGKTISLKDRKPDLGPTGSVPIFFVCVPPGAALRSRIILTDYVPSFCGPEPIRSTST